MLILTRREGESIMLTREGLEPIEVKVLRVDGAQVYGSTGRRSNSALTHRKR